MSLFGTMLACTLILIALLATQVVEASPQAGVLGEKMANEWYINVFLAPNYDQAAVFAVLSSYANKVSDPNFQTVLSVEPSVWASFGMDTHGAQTYQTKQNGPWVFPATGGDVHLLVKCTDVADCDAERQSFESKLGVNMARSEVTRGAAAQAAIERFKSKPKSVFTLDNGGTYVFESKCTFKTDINPLVPTHRDNVIPEGFILIMAAQYQEDASTGLMFYAYSEDQQIFDRMLTRMVNTPDVMMSATEVIRSNYYYAPSNEELVQLLQPHATTSPPSTAPTATAAPTTTAPTPLPTQPPTASQPPSVPPTTVPTTVYY